MSLRLIAEKLERLTWRRRLWGVDERQVWHVVRRMDEMYRQLYREQEVRYQALLSQASGQGTAPSAGTHRPAAGSTAGLSAARLPTEGPHLPPQAVPASPPPARFQGETAPQPPSAPLPPIPGSHRFRTS